MNNYNKQNPATIESMFDNIANDYDKANAYMSFKLFKRWNKALIEKVKSNLSSKPVLLDLCAGTGDIALTYLQQEDRPAKAYLLDFSKQMLSHAQKKAATAKLEERHTIEYLLADAHNIPLQDTSVDVVTIAYGIRNVKHADVCAADVFRVLKPGGCLAILELTRPENPLLRWGHALYLKTLLPLMARLCTSEKGAYRYLSSSIEGFIPPDHLQKILCEAGFTATEIIPLMGGVATIIFARKGDEAPLA